MSDHRPGLAPGPRIEWLCTGYGGLDLAVELVPGGRLTWYAETDRHARTVPTHRWPDVRRSAWGVVLAAETAGMVVGAG